tara:strand:- start:306 stop:563 length:258 start_codon:yes stop_codon:yes gene_type:complete
MSRYQEEYERYYKKYCQIMMIDIYDFFVTANHEMICSKLDDIACHRIDSSKELMATDEVCIYLNNNNNINNNDLSVSSNFTTESA